MANVTSVMQVNEHADVQQALASVKVRRERLVDCDARERRLSSATDQYRVGNATEDELLEAVADLPDARQARARAALDLKQAEAAHEDAVAAARARVAEHFAARKRAQIVRLKAAALKLRVEADALAEIEDAEQDALGPQAERFSAAFAFVMTSTPTFLSLLDHWIATTRENGMLDS